jgi:hypothetical protein
MMQFYYKIYVNLTVRECFFRVFDKIVPRGTLYWRLVILVILFHVEQFWFIEQYLLISRKFEW